MTFDLQAFSSLQHCMKTPSSRQGCHAPLSTNSAQNTLLSKSPLQVSMQDWEENPLKLRQGLFYAHVCQVSAVVR